MRERWEELVEFPDYAVSDQGYVANMRTGLPRKNSRNGTGHCKVSMYDREGSLLTRSVAVLVANAFLVRDEMFHDTVIHLNGDLMDCRVDNLMWRPRWFAIKYHKQFRLDTFHLDQADRIDIDTGEIYHGLKELCTRNGLYYYDVIKSCVEQTFVPITFQEFRSVA